VLSIPNATALTVTINGETEATYDYIYIYDQDGNNVDQFDGSIEEEFTVSGSSITVRLVTDGSVTDDGVTVTVSEADINNPDVTTWTTGAYDNYEDRSKTLSIPDAQELIVTVKGETESDYDYITIYDRHGHEIKRLSGDINTELTVKGSLIRARLKSDYSITKSGVTVTIKDSGGTPNSSCLTRGELLEMIDNNEDVTEVNTSCITDMSLLFYGRPDFNQDISGWDVSNVTDMSRMFEGDSWGQTNKFNQPIGEWDTSSVADMSNMFAYTDNFNQPIGDWNTNSVTDMHGMFNSGKAFNQPIGNWDTSSVTNMYNIFAYAFAFNQDIGNWDTGSVTSMQYMFSGAKSFNQDISGWDTSSAISMSNMFKHAEAFSYHDLSDWDIAEVTNHADFLKNAGPGNIEPNW